MNQITLSNDKAVPSAARPAHTGLISTTWEIQTYDVWGNAKEGYDVNDVYRRGEVELEIPCTLNNAGTPTEFVSAYPTNKLIAAAPELFAVAQRLARFADRTPQSLPLTIADLQGIVNDAHAAVSKATLTTS